MSLWRKVCLTSAVSILMILSVVPARAAALAVPAAPTDIPVVDQTGTLTDQQRRSLGDKIAQERSDSGNQIAVLMVKNLDGDAIEDYSLRVAREWGIGQKDRDSGVLLFVAKDDRRVRIEVGYGLEGALPDVRASRIIQDRIAPQFREGKFYEGLDAGVDGVVAAINGEKDPQLSSGQTKRDGADWWAIIGSTWWIVLLVFVWLSSVLARTKSWWLGGLIGGGLGLVVALFVGFLFIGVIAIGVLALLGLLLDWSVSRNYKQAASGSRDMPSWWAGGPWLGGGGTGGGSGGFGGFGGGGFGGGGASGDW